MVCCPKEKIILIILYFYIILKRASALFCFSGLYIIVKQVSQDLKIVLFYSDQFWAKLLFPAQFDIVGAIAKFALKELGKRYHQPYFTGRLIGPF
jgi:hypothetical protein